MQDIPESEPTTDDGEFDLVVPYGVLGVRLDKQLAQLLPEHSRARLQGWIESGHVWVNHTRQTKVRHPVSEGDVLTVVPQPSEQELAFSAQPVDFEVVAQSDQWIVVNKPVGLVVHPGAGNWNNTLLNGLLFRFPELASIARAGIVHRLDKDTSGLMVIARTPVAQTSLVRQLQARSVRREYAAIVHGWVEPAQGTIEREIGRDPRVAVRMTVERPIAPRQAITHYEAVRFGEFDGTRVTLVHCRLETGRTHQIRVHLASVGHPLVGDALYGGKPLGDACRQMLHAMRLQFDDPLSGQPQHFETSLAQDLLALIERVHWCDQQESIP